MIYAKESKEETLNRTDIIDHGPKYKDFTGMTVGSVYVIREVAPHYKPDGSPKYRYLCRCNECGDEFITYKDTLAKHIKDRSPFTCGCDTHYKPIQVGEKINKLTVEYLVSKGPIRMQNRWRCKCECGREVDLYEVSLIKRTTKDCGFCGPVRIKHEPLKIGDKFGRLTIVQAILADKIKDERYICDCDCGTKNVVRTFEQLTSRTGSKSCGCLNTERLQKLHESMRTVNGLSKTPLYQTYRGMISRCYDPNEDHYKDYGGRGIQVCDEWRGENGFINFYNWALPLYQDGLTIDRIDVNGNYCPENCRFAPWLTQANNKRNNSYVTIGNDTYTVSRWAEASGIYQKTIAYRLSHGYSPYEAVYTPTPFQDPSAIYFVDDYNNPISQFDVE